MSPDLSPLLKGDVTIVTGGLKGMVDRPGDAPLAKGGMSSEMTGGIPNPSAANAAHLPLTREAT